MKKIALLTALFLVIVLLSSCNSVPAMTVQPPAASSSAQVTASPDETHAPVLTPVLSASPSVAPQTPQTAVAGGGDIVLTDTQKKKIDALLTGALNMSDIDTESGTFFQDASTLPMGDLLGFAYIILSDEPVSVGRKSMDTSGPVSSKFVEDIIRSAFGVDYKPRKGDCAGEGLQYTGGSFMFAAGDDALIAAYPFSFTRQPSDSLLIKFNMIYDYVPGTGYEGKGEAVLLEDTKSLFGYRLVSLTKANDADITFTGAEASSSLPADGSSTYIAANAIDGKDGTAWVTNGGKGEWIRLSFDKPQDINGLVLHFGDWSSNDAFEKHALPASCRLDFSDGTSIVDKFCQSYEIGDDTCFAFDKVINTSYIKITITDITEGTAGGGVYVSEIKPI